MRSTEYLPAGTPDVEIGKGYGHAKELSTGHSPP